MTAPDPHVQSHTLKETRKSLLMPQTIWTYAWDRQSVGFSMCLCVELQTFRCFNNKQKKVKNIHFEHDMKCFDNTRQLQFFILERRVAAIYYLSIISLFVYAARVCKKVPVHAEHLRIVF